MAKKRMTMEDLARLVAQGFSEVNAKVDLLTDDLGSLRRDVEHHAGEHSDRLASVEHKVDALIRLTDTHDRSITTLNRRIRS